MCMTTDNQTMLKLQHFLKATCMMTIALTAFGCSDDDPTKVLKKTSLPLQPLSKGSVPTHALQSPKVEKEYGIRMMHSAYSTFRQVKALPTSQSSPARTQTVPVVVLPLPEN